MSKNEMLKQPIIRISGSALVTTITLSSILWIAFSSDMLDNLVIHQNLFTEIASGSIMLVSLLFGSGALWGAGLGLLFQVNPKPIAKTGALNWGISSFLIAVILEFVNGFHSEISIWLGTSRHFVFATAFVVSVGVVVYWCVQKIYSKFSQADTGAKAALICGVAAALAYFLVDRYMVSQGWVLGQPQINGASVMITIMLYGISAAALTGGGILGWFLHDASEKDSYNKIDLAVTGIKND